MKIAAGSRLLFIGDSVTDVGRSYPVAEGLFDPLGKGYVNIVNGLITATYPGEKIHVINVGCSGNTIRDLKARWQTDVIDLKPDWVSIMIGINDVWRQFDVPMMQTRHVLPEEYRATLEELVKTTLPLLKGGIVIMTPYYIEPNKNDAMRARMDEYGAICRETAEKYNTVFIDTQAVFDDLLKHHHSSFFSWDRVHPNIPGHSAIARAFLKGIGYQW